MLAAILSHVAESRVIQVQVQCMQVTGIWSINLHIDTPNI